MSDYGIVTESGAVRFQRLLPAPVERVWDYLTQSELRGRWFASGEMELRPGGRVTLVFHNSTLAPEGEETPEPYRRYEGMESSGRVIACDPPRRLVHSWGEEDGTETEVEYALEPRGDETLLTLTHRRLATRAATLDVSGGWHLHLDALEDVLAGRGRRPFWSRQEALAQDYAARIGES